MNDQYTNAVSDAEELARVQGRLRSVLWRTPEGLGLLRKSEWVAVPAESSLHLSETDRLRLRQAFEEAGFECVYAVALEDLDNVAALLRVAVSLSGLADFNHKCAHFNYALCPPDVSSLVICSATGDFLAFVGTPEFVETAVGQPVIRAFEAFEGFARDAAWTVEQKRYFLSLLETLHKTYPSLNDGQFVLLLS